MNWQIYLATKFIINSILYNILHSITIIFNGKLLVFRSICTTFAADMRITNKEVNIILALVAAGLLAVCVASVASAM